MASITDKYKIEDLNIRQAIQKIEKDASEGKAGNSIVSKKEIKMSDASKLKEGVIHFDQLPDYEKTKRMVVRIGNKTYKIPLIPLDEETT